MDIVETCIRCHKHAGRSRIRYVGYDSWSVQWHMWTRDFFTSVANVPFWELLLGFFVIYTACFMLWGFVWWALWRIDSSCVVALDGFSSAFIFSIATQQTIGYGNRYPGDCWISAVFVLVQSFMAMVLDSLFLGIVFAKLAHPKQRAYTIFISDSAVLARQDGVLKFMFRVADIREYSIIDPKIRASLYIWGPGRTTAEGEHIPLDVQQLECSSYDDLFVVPTLVEHIIDERSPLFGHTRETLESLNAEIVVALEGTNEFGDTFAARQSYLPSEMSWGCVFSQILHKAPAGGTRHYVNVAAFHAVEALPEWRHLGQYEISRQLAREGCIRGGAIPYPKLGSNSLLLASACCITATRSQVTLSFRIADVYRVQIPEAQVRAYLVTWDMPKADGLCHTKELSLSRSSLPLNFPATVTHVIDSSSPLAALTSAAALAKFPQSDIMLVVEGYVLKTASMAVRTASYNVASHVRWGHEFAPCMIRSQGLGMADVAWQAFHATYNVQGGQGTPEIPNPIVWHHVPPAVFAHQPYDADEVQKTRPGPQEGPAEVRVEMAGGSIFGGNGVAHGGSSSGVEMTVQPFAGAGSIGMRADGKMSLLDDAQQRSSDYV